MASSSSRRLRSMLASKGPEFILEAHNALSALIAAEAGFAGIWASSLTLSGAAGCRDNNELSMTQVLEVLESMTDRTSIPILFDGDTGYGTFNHFQRLVRKLCQRGVAGVCIEDKIFPKTNSFIASEQQLLAPVDEFCGKLRAGKDAQTDPDFVVVARTEALITGMGLPEALDRAARYADAGADAILVHSKARTVDEISAFMAKWKRDVPIVCVPTTYYGTPPEVFETIGVSLVIWANHMLRGAVRAMRAVAEQLRSARTARVVEDQIAPVKEVFRLQDAPALEEAERIYATVRGPSAIILAASRGAALGPLTESRPKCMVHVGGEPIINKLLQHLRTEGVRDLSIVRGWAKDKLVPPGVTLFDNDRWDATGELASLHAAREAIRGDVLVAYGDLLVKRYIVHDLLSSAAPLTIVVDVSRQFRSAQEVDLVELSGRVPAPFEDSACTLRRVASDLPESEADGEWAGLLYTRGAGTEMMRAALAELMAKPGGERLSMGDLLNHMVERMGAEIHVVFVRGDWIDIDTFADIASERME